MNRSAWRRAAAFVVVCWTAFLVGCPSRTAPSTAAKPTTPGKEKQERDVLTLAAAAIADETQEKPTGAADERPTESQQGERQKAKSQKARSQKDQSQKEQGKKDQRKPAEDKQPTQDAGEPPAAQAEGEQPAEGNHPFPRRVPMPEFPRDMTWLNTSGPLRLKDLRGKFVLLDFWTYCCINCIHILPELKKLEQKYPNELVVIGVHSAKFDTEKDTKSIEEAILRYEIEHPVVNDADHVIWNSLGVESWPTTLMIDPEGNAFWGRPGEVTFAQLDAVMQAALPYYREKKLVDSRPLRFDLAAYRQDKTPLRFPGKVLADEPGGRLFIADSNHNRLVVTTLEGKLLEIIGSGAIGQADGGYTACSFNKPQGMVLDGQVLYVADTENHLLRAVDLEKKQVSTIAGVGVQGRGWPGIEKLGPFDPLPESWDVLPLEAELNSPWDLWIHGEDLYIAMAGPHQIWKMPLDGSVIGPFAGSGREDILDGPLLPRRPYAEDHSAFAQPSGLASDGEWLFVADSEGSSIRAVPFDPKLHVKTIVGTADLPYGRLFTFGDVDGPPGQARLQHPLGVVYRDGVIYVADTYNNKIKAVDAKTGELRTVAGTGEAGLKDDPAQFDEPAGITLAANRLYVADTNNHAVRVVDLSTGKVSTLAIEGLSPPTPPAERKKPNFASAQRVDKGAVSLRPVDGKIALRVELALPEGWKINPLAPMAYYIQTEGDVQPGENGGPIGGDEVNRQVKLPTPAASFDIALSAASGQAPLTVFVTYYYCQEGAEGLCKVGQVGFDMTLSVSDDASETGVSLEHAIKP